MSGTGSPGATPAEEQGSTWELLNEELRLRMETQRKAFDRIEARAAIVLGAAFAALQFIAEKEVKSGWLPFAIGAYGLAMALSLIAVWPGGFLETKPRSVLVGLWQYPRGRAAAELANERLRAFETNVGRQARMVRLVRASVILAVLGAMISTAQLTRGEHADVDRGSPAGCSANPSSCGAAP